MTKLSVYNLEFPAYVNELNIAGYKFRRVDDYETAFSRLQHLISMFGSEFPIVPNTGVHQKTAVVEIPDTEQTAILPWVKESNFTLLQDVLLFLSLFTGREVFILNSNQEGSPIIRDPRSHHFGGNLRLTLRHDPRWRHKETGELKVYDENVSHADYDLVDLGLEQTISKILEIISSPEWQKIYGSGYFIFTYNQVIHQRDADAAFVLSWTIWEHLFTLHNKHWLDDTAIQQMSGEKKVAFVLNKYLNVPIDDKARKAIGKLAKARNRMVHYGERPENFDIKELVMLVRVTEQLVAITLGLEISDGLSSIEHLKIFLSGRTSS